MIRRIFRRLYKTFYIKVYGLNRYLRKRGVQIGKNPHIYSDISTTESYLIKIGDNVTISNGVQFVTHDNSVCKILENVTDVFGEIQVGDNCFIGARSILMYGVTIPNNTIVAAGSVVTKSIAEEGKIIGGNPAKVIGDVHTLACKLEPYAINLDAYSSKEKKEAILNCPHVKR
jgi:acetyltransferase-like isoleucine patch superfamily enzyme